MANLRRRILDATEQLLRKAGRAHVTTRSIAKAAGCSDGALYKHFSSLDELLLELFKEKIPAFTGLHQLALHVGEGEVTSILAKVLETGLAFFRSALPLWLVLAGDEPLRKAYFARMKGEARGPHIPIEGIAAFLRAEQRLGRVRKEADPVAGAELLVASILTRALSERAWGRHHDAAADRRWAQLTADTVCNGLSS